MIEMALVLPILIIITTGVIQYGMIFQAYIAVRNASAIGARFAILNGSPSDSDIRDVVTQALAPSLDTSPTYLTPPAIARNQTAGPIVNATRVTVTYSLPVIFPVPGSTNGRFPLSAETLMW